MKAETRRLFCGHCSRIVQSSSLLSGAPGALLVMKETLGSGQITGQTMTPRPVHDLLRRLSVVAGKICCLFTLIADIRASGISLLATFFILLGYSGIGVGNILKMKLAMLNCNSCEFSGLYKTCFQKSRKKALSVVNSVRHISRPGKKKGILLIVPIRLSEIVFQ